MRRWPLLLFALALAAASCGAPEGMAAADDAALARRLLGFNWGNAAKVYVLHWDQRSVTAKDPSRPFRVAQKDRVSLVRGFE